MPLNKETKPNQTQQDITCAITFLPFPKPSKWRDILNDNTENKLVQKGCFVFFFLGDFL